MKRSSLALFNGSYLGTKLTGIGVVARELINNLSEENIRLLDPFGSSRKGSIPIPNNLHPQFGAKGHFRRLIWTQKNQSTEIVRGERERRRIHFEVLNRDMVD